MKHFHWTVIRAAVKHAQRPEVHGEPADLVRYYIRCLAVELQRAGRYTLAYDVRQLGHMIDEAGAVNPVYQELRRMFANNSASEVAQPTPASNTGVTPVQLNILEDYVNGK